MNDLLISLDYSFKNEDLIQLALTHKSLAKNNNERLEFLGDAILNLYVSERLFNTYDDLKEGKLTQFKASIVSRENLHTVASKISLAKYIKIGKGERLEGNSIVGNVLEAVIGAIFLDSSYSETKTVLDKLFIDDFIRLDEDKELKDSKSILQELIQKQYKSLPRYSVNQESSNKQNNYFEVSCFVDEENLTAQGTGKTIKRAELNAASNMLELIKV
jgi:ribonuclease-3|tara:strand:+ start:533 stop:1183 length:651 start_codon:yes stop_codon:yes gene_type:complete